MNKDSESTKSVEKGVKHEVTLIPGNKVWSRDLNKNFEKVKFMTVQILICLKIQSSYPSLFDGFQYWKTDIIILY